MDELELIRLKKMEKLLFKPKKKTPEKEVTRMGIIVYSTRTCPYCAMAKNYLSSLGIDYEDVLVDVDHDRAMEMIAKSGQTGVPVIDIDGDIVIGFNKELIDTYLKKHGYLK